MPQPWEMEFESPSDTTTEIPPWEQDYHGPIESEVQPSLLSRFKEGALAGGEAGLRAPLDVPNSLRAGAESGLRSIATKTDPASLFLNQAPKYVALYLRGSFTIVYLKLEPNMISLYVP